MENVKETKKLKAVLGILGKIGIVLLETVLLVVFALYGVMYILAKGPSPTARDLFVLSVRETSAVGFLANLFFTDEQIASMREICSDKSANIRRLYQMAMDISF